MAPWELVWSANRWSVGVPPAMCSHGRKRLVVACWPMECVSACLLFVGMICQPCGGLHSRLDPHGVVELVDFWAAPIDENLNSFLREMECCDVFIGERLHASVLAAVVNRPFVPIGYKPKCFDFVESLQIEGLRCLEPDNLQGDDLYNLVNKAMAAEPNREQLAERVKLYQSRICEGAEQIMDSVRRIGGVR